MDGILSGRCSIIVPIIEADGDRSKSVVEAVAHALCQTCGGATMNTVEGYWLSPAGELHTDSGVQCVAYYDRDNGDITQTVFGLGQMVKDRLEQEAVAVELDGVLHFV